MIIAKGFRKVLLVVLITGVLVIFISTFSVATVVIRGDGQAYILDRTGVRWLMTQAETLGFRLERFLFGIGKDAYVPLDDKYFSDPGVDIFDGLRVIGLADGDEAKAYSIPRISRHEVVNSSINEKPVAVIFCPLVDLAAAYSRTIDDQVLTMHASGWIYNDTCVLYDQQTITIWFPYEKGLMGIQGKHFERWLPVVPSEDTKWKRWYQKHPRTRILR